MCHFRLLFIHFKNFGFGKQLNGANRDENSVFLNWPATEMPNDVKLNQEYDERTEIYFVGTLFKHLLGENIDDFRYQHIIEKMTKINPIQRYSSFTEISNDISAGVLSEIDFSDAQKEIYREFAGALRSHIIHYSDKHRLTRAYSPLSVAIDS